MGSQKALAVAVVFGVLAAVSVWGTLRGIHAEYSGNSEMVPSLVAKRSIASGESLDEGAVEIRSIPRPFRQKGTLASPADLSGKFAAVKIFPGDQVTSEKVTVVGGLRGLSALLRPGSRAVAVRLRDTSMGLRLKPGDRVDVVGVWNDTGDGHDLAKTIVADAEILAVGRLAAKGAGEPALALGGDPSLGEGDIVLAVSADEGQRIALVQSVGEISVTLRASGDHASSPQGPAELRPSRATYVGDGIFVGQPAGLMADEALPLPPDYRTAMPQPVVSARDSGRLGETEAGFKETATPSTVAVRAEARSEKSPAPSGAQPVDPTIALPVFRIEVFRGAEKSVEEVPCPDDTAPAKANGRGVMVDEVEH